MKKLPLILAFVIATIALLQADPKSPDMKEFPENTQVATLGSGCFWCGEEIFHQTKGVLSAVAGYMGGDEKTATYDHVKKGKTDHVEVVQVHFDPEVISFEKVLDQFFDLHDPTQLNRQGADIGTQYRSVIFYHDDLQRAASEQKIKELTEAERFGRPIVTAVEPAEAFYVAEDYHQDFARRNPDNGYIEAVLDPKLKKLGLEKPE